ncbi:hypothetical protein MHU86_6801 [Fragilaria crotonensis]|nr:hypothetical protein MHU86_6801 [Fragilaria crotonensis]
MKQLECTKMSAAVSYVGGGCGSPIRAKSLCVQIFCGFRIPCISRRAGDHGKGVRTCHLEDQSFIYGYGHDAPENTSNHVGNRWGGKVNMWNVELQQGLEFKRRWTRKWEWWQLVVCVVVSRDCDCVTRNGDPARTTDGSSHKSNPWNARMRLQPLAISSTAIAITATFLSTGFRLSTCQATFVINSDGGHHKKRRNFAMAFKTKTNIDDAAVLTELKDTIRRQAIEIEELKKTQLSPSTSLATSSHGGHGGAPIEDATSYMSKSFTNCTPTSRMA